MNKCIKYVNEVLNKITEEIEEFVKYSNDNYKHVSISQIIQIINKYKR